jgi:transposase
MATRQKFRDTEKVRRMRTFSEEFKRKKVQEIERKISTIAEISRQYDVRPNNVTKWVKLYSINYMAGARFIVESESDTVKLIEYQKKIAELERLLGQKQVVIEFQNKIIELAEVEYKIDIKKKLEAKL